ncbi:MAG: hypothetical protein GYB42_01765 [Alphaproteobacteria bacterium]|nr:hypothetical protein [Alphaproteobacteria bacterium]
MSDHLLLKQLASATAFILTFAAFYPYIRGILKGTVKPHVFSWFIWGAGTFVVFLAQLSDGAGLGGWPVGLSGVITVCVAALAWQRATDRSIVPIDWLFLGLALSALPFWYFTQTPLAAVLILTLVDMLGFGPTMRKGYHFPYEENVSLFAISIVRNGFILLALEHYSWTTVLFPAAVGTACIIFVGMLVWRRQAVSV